ncbi:MAG TPA: shikimate dehydrogenase [Bacteroidales bacterium]|nr:MAG: shikimate dehydrogenase [Bacteroidetes bacterium GWF2_33_38]OFY70757.1 MAG: shikimate dehydrogenase [Bacteroidetes bacterium RIFOXYA12_FULL_33_9]OFY85961.1 MAG: shikimate dehydrogenase [Bacteroidetes bacterium RIFOXYA2_FULL_33_7]HBF88757.1 shikimate dehydrogenase [Bacteroidales bacterium]
MDLYGLIGFPLAHSYSKRYFTEKFAKEGISASYELFPIEDITKIHNIILQHHNLKGFNVTIPHKENIISFLDEIDSSAKDIGAINTVKVIRSNSSVRLIGYNTDVYGFEKAFLSTHRQNPTKVLVIGTGGSSKAVSYVLKKYNIDFKFVSRSKKENCLLYSELSDEILTEFNTIVNTTPVGMSPDILAFPAIPYEFISTEHTLFDLIYNPNETVFLKKGKERGAIVINGLDMLYFQAEKAFEIWNL